MRARLGLVAVRAAAAIAVVPLVSLSSAAATTQRVAVSDYFTTATGDIPAGVICTETDQLRGNGLGNVCFPIHEGESRVVINIVDKYQSTVGAHYEFGIRGNEQTAVVSTGVLCKGATLDIPAPANELRLYFGLANVGAPAPCTGSPGVQGTVTSTFS